MQNLKREDTNELIYKTKIHRLKRTSLWLPGRRIGRRDSEGVTNTTHTLHTAVLKWITDKDLLYSTWNSTQCYVAAWMGGEF